MNQPPSLHWIPVCPSWIVSAGIVLLAVLPHKIPYFGRHVLANTTARLLFAAFSVYVWMLKPVLGTALLILLASVSMLPDSEPFTTMKTLNKDRIKEHKNWFVEDVLAEKPRGIQELTDETNLNFDEIPDDSLTWHQEKILDEHPTAIQNKPVHETTVDDIWH